MGRLASYTLEVGYMSTFHFYIDESDKRGMSCRKCLHLRQLGAFISCQCVPHTIPSGYMYIFASSQISTEESVKHLNER